MIEIFALPFMQAALYAGVLLALLCAVLGIHIVLQRRVFLSAAVSQVATLGMALGFYFGWHPTLSALLTILSILFLLSRFMHNRYALTDTLLGVIYVSAFAISILLMSKSAQGYEELQHLLQGNLLTLTSRHLLLITLLFVSTFSLFFLFHKEILFTSFDANMAQTLGYRVHFWNLFFYFLIGMVISAGVQTVGSLLIFGLLVVPPFTALLLTKKFKTMYFASAVIAVMAVWLGLWISFLFDLPSGPAIILLLLFCVGALAAGKNGLARIIR
jgi:ABC-type Mn2+/Zn2+ transport system permease subunit